MSQKPGEETQQAGSGGLSGAKIGGRVREDSVDEVMPDRPSPGTEPAELSISRSGGVGNPIYGDYREWTAWDPGTDKWWKPYVDAEGETEHPETMSDTRVGVVLAECTDEVKQFVAGIIRCTDPKLPAGIRSDGPALKAYRKLVMEYDEAIAHPLPKVVVELRQQAMHEPDVVASKMALICMYLYPHYLEFLRKRARLIRS
jgi:hypothetical protein